MNSEVLEGSAVVVVLLFGLDLALKTKLWTNRWDKQVKYIEEEVEPDTTDPDWRKKVAITNALADCFKIAYCVKVFIIVLPLVYVLNITHFFVREDNSIIMVGSVIYFVLKLISQVIDWIIFAVKYVPMSNKMVERQENEIREEAEHQKQIRRLREIEQARSEGQATGLIMQYQAQIAILAEHKRQGLDIERETLELREKMMAMEREDNKAIIADVMAMMDTMLGGQAQ